MSLDNHSSKPERPLKRSSYGDCEGAPANKSRYLPPTPPAFGHRPDKLHPPSRPQSIAPTLPETAEPSVRGFENFKPACDPATTRRIDDWLVQILSDRSSSASPGLPACQTPATVNLDEYQGPTFAAMQEMLQSQGQGAVPVSGTSVQSSRAGASNKIYPSILYYNGVRMDHTGEKIPKVLRDFLDSAIFKPRSSQLSPEEIAEIVTTVLRIADDPEDRVYKLTSTAMFPISRRNIRQGGNTPWHSDALPRNALYPNPLATPKPDIHCGYSISTNPEPFWSLEEKAVIDHPAVRRLSQPANCNCYPFLVLELKSEATGGTLLHAERQAAGSGASCVNSMRWLLKEAYPSQTRSIIDSIAFSISVTHREAIFHVHFYRPEDDLHYMSWIASFESLRNPQGCSHVVENILDLCLGARQTKVRQALAQLVPFPRHWKTSRPASTQASQAADEETGSNKIQRTE